jgi:uncharacterized damage-inducible protein DinB
MVMAGQNISTDSLIAQAFLHQARTFLRTDYLPKIKRCLEKLTDEQVWWRPNEESNSIGNLMLHLSGNARQWIVSGLGGESDQRIRQREFDERSVIPRDQLMATLEQTLEEVDRVLASFKSERLLEQFAIQGTNPTALEAIFHVVEHFSMHTGQIILLTKLLTASDVDFYDFEGVTPLPRWRSDRS